MPIGENIGAIGQALKNTSTSTVVWVRDIFMDGGVPSSSRILMYILAVFVMECLTKIVAHICLITDQVQLGLWLSALPMLIGAFAGLIAAPYLINKGAGSISDFANMFKK